MAEVKCNGYWRKSMIKGFIFDFNGTLYFDTDKQEEAWWRYFRKHANREIGPTEFRDHIHGVDKKLMVEEKEAFYREISWEDKANLRLVDGAIEVMDELKARGIPFTIATASEISNVSFYFEAFPLNRWFSGPQDLAYFDGSFPGKPAPDTYLRAAEKIGVAPADCLVIEDSVPGLESARNAGIGTLVAIAPAQDRESIEKMPDVTAVLENYYGFLERFLP
jgi:beta-phosphoglucomutase-like phosphatase (HAD superfamily)